MGGTDSHDRYYLLGIDPPLAQQDLAHQRGTVILALLLQAQRLIQLFPSDVPEPDRDTAKWSRLCGWLGAALRQLCTPNGVPPASESLPADLRSGIHPVTTRWTSSGIVLRWVTDSEP